MSLTEVTMAGHRNGQTDLALFSDIFSIHVQTRVQKTPLHFTTPLHSKAPCRRGIVFCIDLIEDLFSFLIICLPINPDIFTIKCDRWEFLDKPSTVGKHQCLNFIYLRHRNGIIFNPICSKCSVWILVIQNSKHCTVRQPRFWKLIFGITKD